MATETTSVATQKMDYMTLLITELQNQNPLEPMDNQQMAAQLAQFSQLELSEETNSNISTMNDTMSKMNSSFEGAMFLVQMEYAKSLLGKTVNFSQTGSNTVLEGKVKKITFQEDGTPVMNVKSGETSYSVTLDQIEGIQE